MKEHADDIILCFDSYILELEESNKWQTVSNTVYQNWKRNPWDLNLLLCAGTQLWYTRYMMDYLKDLPSAANSIEYADNKMVESMLLTVSTWGLEHFRDNATFNAYFGYMFKVMPHFFGDYLAWHKEGILMMRKSVEIDPKNLFANAMALEMDDYDKYYVECKKLWERYSPSQWGRSGVQQYFFRILCGESFYENAYEE